MIWGFDGLMNGVWNGGASIRAIDFAGGTVVHMCSGWSALVLCLMLGPRKGFGKQPMPPHSMVLCSIGTGMLWVGWYGFNAGSALAADGIASNAFATDNCCCCCSELCLATDRVHQERQAIDPRLLLRCCCWSGCDYTSRWFRNDSKCLLHGHRCWRGSLLGMYGCQASLQV